MKKKEKEEKSESAKLRLEGKTTVSMWIQRTNNRPPLSFKFSLGLSGSHGEKTHNQLCNTKYQKRSTSVSAGGQQILS